MTSGVYTISAPNGEQYVGSSKNVERRFSQHKTQLSTGIHPNPKLRSWAQEFGVDRLAFDLVLACDEADLWINEQNVIDNRRPSANQRNIVGTKGGEDCIKTAFRCPPGLYSQIVTQALENRMSINSYIVSILQEAADNDFVPKAKLSESALSEIEQIVRKVLSEKS